MVSQSNSCKRSQIKHYYYCLALCPWPINCHADVFYSLKWQKSMKWAWKICVPTCSKVILAQLRINSKLNN